MSLLLHPFDIQFTTPSFRHTVERTAARFHLGLRRQPVRLVEEEMPDWQLRDLGFRDGRATTARTDRVS